LQGCGPFFIAAAAAPTPAGIESLTKQQDQDQRNE